MLPLRGFSTSTIHVFYVFFLIIATGGTGNVQYGQYTTQPGVILKRLEQRRRLHKSRTASCSSSDASDDDTENRYSNIYLIN